MKLLTRPLELALLPDAIILINAGSKIANPKLVNGKWTGMLDLSASRLGKEAITKYKGVEQGMAAIVLNQLYNSRAVMDDRMLHNYMAYLPSEKTPVNEKSPVPLYRLGLFQTMDSQNRLSRNIIKRSVRYLATAMRCLKDGTVPIFLDNPWGDTQPVDQAAFISLYEELPAWVCMFGVDKIGTPLTPWDAIMNFPEPEQIINGYTVDMHGIRSH